MSAEPRSRCRITVSRDMVQITYQNTGDRLFQARGGFDCRAATQLQSAAGRVDPRAYGRALYDLLLMADPKQQVSAVFARCFDDPAVRVQVAIEIVDETLAGLLELRWEHLCDADERCLALDDRLRLVRRLGSAAAGRGRPLDEPPRVLVVVSSPDNLESFSVPGAGTAGPPGQSFAPLEAPFLPQQTLALAELFGGLKGRRRIADYRILRGPLPPPYGEHPALLPGRPTLNGIHDALQAAEKAGQPYHVLHFLAHGYVDENGGYLLLSDEMGDAALVRQSAFRSLFPQAHGVRLAFLAACQSGSGEQRIGRPLAGLAPTFVQVGIPAVIGMQDEISVRGAAAFTATFYEELTAHGYVDTAMVEARREMERRAPSDAEWGIPVLYVQDEEPRLLCPRAGSQAGPEAAANPFSTSGRINDPALFSGRQQIVREICAELRKGCSVAVVGESQIGKSSLLYYLYKTAAAWNAGGVVEFVDLQGVLDEADFCETVLGKLGESGSTLRDLKRAMADRKLILLLDEVERLAEPDFSPRLHDLLRSLAQESHFAMCLATERPLEDVFPSRTPGGVSPFYNIFTTKHLGPYSRAEAKEMLTARAAAAGVIFGEQEIERLLADSGCHPARLQAMAREHFERKGR